jgi:Ulp1 family protease
LKASILDLEQGIVTIPKKDSWVLATIIDGVETRAFISQFSEVDRLMGRIQGTNEPKLLFDYSSDGEVLQIRYVKTEIITETDETKIIDIAKIEFNKDKNFKISYFDDDEKPLATTHFTSDSLTTTFNSIKDKQVKERVAFTLRQGEATLKLNNQEGKKQSTLTIDQGKISGLLYDDQEAEKLVFEVNSENDSIQLKKNDKNLIELKGKTAITLKSEGDINIEAKNINIKSTEKININATGDTIISGEKVKIN